MATSGVNNFQVTRDDVIAAALRGLGFLPAGVSPTTDDLTNCSQALNIMIKSWAKKGLPLWVVDDITLTMVDGVSKYPVGPTAGYIHEVTIANGGTGYPATGIVTFTGGTTGTVATGTYVATDGVITAVTITNPGSSYTSLPTLSFSGGGTGIIATPVKVGLTISKPLRVIEAFIRSSNNEDTTLSIVSKQEYVTLGNKFSPGVPNQLYFDSKLTNAFVYVYNVPTDSTYTLYLTTQRMFEDMSAGTDNFDFPQAWFQAIKWNLMAEICTEYNADKEMIPYYTEKARITLEEAFNESVEEASVTFVMDNR